MSDSGVSHIPPANAAGDGATIVAAVNQLPLAHQNTVVVCLLAGVADPDLSAVSARHLVFVSVHLAVIPISELRIVLTIRLEDRSLATMARMRSMASLSHPALRAASMVN